MCIQNALQQHILDITNDGKDIADFFRATMHGQNPNAKFHHQMEAAKQLRKLGLPTTPEHKPPLPQGESWGEGTSPSSPPSMSAPVTDSDIINYEVAALIREETGDGYFIADFLARVMRGTAGQGRPVSESDRLRAAMELMNRGLGRFGDTRDRRISDSQDELIHSGLSRYIRERTDNGLHAARFLLDVASGQEQSFSMHQRVVATRELVRRGWDTNYDAITPEDIAAYRERQDAIEPTEYDIRLQELRESELAAQEERDEQVEDEPQLEAGLFAYLSFAEIDRYEAMGAEDKREFVERQRQLRASRQSAEAHQTTPSPSPQLVIPAEAGIQRGCDGSENHENTDRNTIIQEINAPSPNTPSRQVRIPDTYPQPLARTPYPITPLPKGEGWVRVKSQKSLPPRREKARACPCADRGCG